MPYLGQKLSLRASLLNGWNISPTGRRQFSSRISPSPFGKLQSGKLISATKLQARTWKTILRGARIDSNRRTRGSRKVAEIMKTGGWWNLRFNFQIKSAPAGRKNCDFANVIFACESEASFVSTFYAKVARPPPHSVAIKGCKNASGRCGSCLLALLKCCYLYRIENVKFRLR